MGIEPTALCLGSRGLGSRLPVIHTHRSYRQLGANSEVALAGALNQLGGCGRRPVQLLQCCWAEHAVLDESAFNALVQPRHPLG